MRIRTGVIAVLIALTSLTACGSEDDAPVQSPTPSGVAVGSGGSTQFNPCVLINSTDVSHATGDYFDSLASANPSVTGPFAERKCAYEGTAGTGVLVQTMLDDQPGGGAWKRSLEAAKSDAAGSFYEPAPGIGDEAFFGPVGTVVARRSYLVVIITIDGTTTDTRQPLRELASTAMSRVA